jgi:hypothetical protein
MTALSLGPICHTQAIATVGSPASHGSYARIENPSNAVWAGPVSALRWVPLSAYAADGKSAACSKGHALQWVWGIVRWVHRDFIRTRYRRSRFSTSLQEIWQTGDIYSPIN